MGKKITLTNPKQAYLHKKHQHHLTDGDITGLMSGRLARVIAGECSIEMTGKGKGRAFLLKGPDGERDVLVTETNNHRLKQIWAGHLYQAVIAKLRGPQP